MSNNNEKFQGQQNLQSKTVNQNNRPVRPIRHDWRFDKVSSKDLKDLNANQWPFKVIRDAGKQTKMVCHCITDLNKSFEGTPYNLNSCGVVKSRYTLLYEAFKGRYANMTDKITHLFLTFDSLYFITSDSPEVKHFKYASNPLTAEDAKGVIGGYLYKSKYFEKIIKDDFEFYKENNNDEMLKNQLMKDIKSYIGIRQGMKVLDNNKPLINVLKSELNFTSLRYLFFAPIPEVAKDYQGFLVEGCRKVYNIEPSSAPKLQEEFMKVISNRQELLGVKSFVQGLENKEYYRSIVKVFYIQNIVDVSPEYVKTLFMKASKSDYLENYVYLSEAEKARIEREKSSTENIVKEFLNNKKNLEIEIRTSYSEILNMLVIMNTMIRTSNNVHQKGLEINNVEYSIWINKYEIEKIKGRIESVYTYRRTKKDEDNDSDVIIEIYPISKIFKLIQEKIGSTDSIDLNTELSYFYMNILPTYFSDERLGIEKLNIDKIDSENMDEVLDSLRNLKTIINNIKSNFMFLFEVFLGVQYATFGAFMMRYGVGGLPMTKMLIGDLVTKYNGKSFCTTKFVEESANLAFYTMQLGIDSLIHYNSVTVSSVSDAWGLGDLAYFVKKYLEAISGVSPLKLKYIDKQDKRYTDLMEVAFNVADILTTCESLVHIDVTQKDNREKSIKQL